MFETFTQSLFSYFCHQQVDFLLIKDSRIIFFCPRCIGLQMGFLFSFVVFFMLSQRYSFVLTRKTIFFILFGIILMLFDWMSGCLNFSFPTEFSRLITGSFCGMSLGVLAHFYNRYLFHKKNNTSLDLPNFFVVTTMIILIPIPYILVTMTTWFSLIAILTPILLINIILVIFHFIFLIKIKTHI